MFNSLALVLSTVRNYLTQSPVTRSEALVIDATVYQRFAHVPPSILDQLFGLCYGPRIGYMRDLLDDFVQGYPTQKLKGLPYRHHRHICVLTANDVVVSWSVLDDTKQIHVWVDKPYRGKGLGTLTLVHMLTAMSKTQRTLMRMNDMNCDGLLAKAQDFVGVPQPTRRLPLSTH